MDLSNLKATQGSVTKRTRVGRGEGSGLGKTCGRGHKGQKARSGGRSARGKEGGQMPLYRRLPKRGFNNKMFQEKICIVNTGRLNIFEDGAKVTAVELYAKGLISNRNLKVKVLGKGTLERKLEVSADFFSKTAKEQIEKAGGTVNVESTASK